MPPISLTVLLFAAIPLQLAFLGGHAVLVTLFPKQTFLREALPLAYLATTYCQWLSFAFVISLKTKNKVPVLMHLPHLLSFLPLIRHIVLASNRTPSDTTSLTLAWVHTVATHMFSLVAAWLWQLKENDKGDLPLREKMRLAFYGAAALTTVIIYAGLDFAFAEISSPWQVGILQLALNLAVTATLLIREHQISRPLPLGAAIFFSLGNAALLFDSARSEYGVEIALAATSLTQFFCLYVFSSFNTPRGQTDMHNPQPTQDARLMSSPRIA